MAEKKIVGEEALRARVKAELAKCSEDEIFEIVVDGVIEMQKRFKEIEQLKKRLQRRK